MLRDQLAYLSALVGANLRAPWTRPVWAFVMAAAMCANNLFFFVTFVVYFANFPNLRGWGRADVALLIGIACWAFGTAILLTDGMRELARRVADGSLDVYLGRPRHPLPALLLSRSTPSGLGDLASALVFWLVLAGRGVAEVPLLVLVASAAAVTLIATVTIFQSVIFWLPRGSQLADELFQMFLSVATNPQHVFSWPVKLLLLTVFPAGFVAYVPVLAVRTADPWLVLLCIAAAFCHGAAAWFVFERGLRRYSSGNRIIELR